MLLVAGIDVVSDRVVRDYTFQWTEGDKQDPFAILTQPQAVVLSERFAQRYGFGLGSAVQSLHLPGHTAARGAGFAPS